MTARYDDPDDAEDVAGEALYRLKHGLMRPLWRDLESEGDWVREEWRQSYLRLLAPSLFSDARKDTRLRKCREHSARVIAERRARLKGEVG